MPVGSSAGPIGPIGPQVPKTNRLSSPRTPLGGYSKTSVLRLLGTNRLKREPLGEVKVQSTRVEIREDQQLSGCGTVVTDTLVAQEGSIMEDLQLSGSVQVITGIQMLSARPARSWGSARRTTPVAIAARPNQKRATPGACGTGGRSKEDSRHSR
jgi:hypothetical protein